MREDLYIDGKWQAGQGNELVGINPATGQETWRGNIANQSQVELAIQAARKSLKAWIDLGFDKRCTYLEKFTQILTEQSQDLALNLSKETGKPLWEAKTEITGMLGKFEISKQAYLDRCKGMSKDMQGYTSVTTHKPHGVIAVLGPFNFPGHLPNGHIIPALLAGNTVVFKPSDLTSHFGIILLKCFEAAGIPAGVLNMVLGGAEVGQQLVNAKDIDGIFFTGSFATGQQIAEASLAYPKRIVALEMGGNNPLIVYKPADIDAAVYMTIQSAFTTAGQRCTCARRLIVVNDDLGKKFVQRLCAVVPNIKVGAYTEQPEPFMGPLISNSAADKVFTAYQQLVHLGAKVLVEMRKLQPKLAFLTPGILDLTNITQPDAEIFGPLLRLTWVEDFNKALIEANNTSYGLSAGLISQDSNAYKEFLNNINAGVVSWNRPTVGSSSAAPFGGLGKSGNHRPSAYYAADYCAYPIACMESTTLELPATLNPGLKL